VLGPVDRHEEPLFIVLNAGGDPVDFVLPPWPRCGHWACTFTTADPDEAQIGAVLQVGAPCEAPSRSVLLFVGSA
jgi:hypothetical protein